MNSLSDDRVRQLMKDALQLPPVDDPRADLWPTVRQRIHQASARPTSIEYALIAALAVLCLLRPSVIEFLLLHL
jgi:hypothetical protein